jgi:hypothetical protein
MYLVREAPILIDVYGESQPARARTFHLPPDAEALATSRWRAETVITLDDVRVEASGASEAEALQALQDEARRTWEARVDEQRHQPSTGDHLIGSGSRDIHSDEPWLTITWDEKHKCVYAEFKGYANSVEFRASCMKILAAIRDRHAAALVSDNRRLEGVVDRDQLWLRDTWAAEAATAGIRRIAVVLPHHGLGKIASENIISRFGETEFVTRTFSLLDDAMTWASEGGPRHEIG